MTKQTRNVLLVLLLIYSVPVLLVGGFVAFAVLRPLPPPVPLPNPNAYDDLVKAGGRVSANTRNYAKMNATQLRPLVNTNAAALTLARDALDGQCRVPVRYSPGGPPSGGNPYPKLRALAQAFAAESRLAQFDHRPRTAAQSDLDLLHLGADAARGGILIDALVGNSIELLGANDLPKLVNQLDAPTCRAAAATVEQLDAQKPSWPEVLKQEDLWIRRTFGWRSVLVELAYHRQMKRSGPKLQRSYQREQLDLRRLMINLASRAYELDKGHRPASSADLVPEYLKAVPKHPVTGKPLG